MSRHKATTNTVYVLCTLQNNLNMIEYSMYAQNKLHGNKNK